MPKGNWYSRYRKSTQTLTRKQNSRNTRRLDYSMSMSYCRSYALSIRETECSGGKTKDRRDLRPWVGEREQTGYWWCTCEGETALTNWQIKSMPWQQASKGKSTDGEMQTAVERTEKKCSQSQQWDTSQEIKAKANWKWVQYYEHPSQASRFHA